MGAEVSVLMCVRPFVRQDGAMVGKKGFWRSPFVFLTWAHKMWGEGLPTSLVAFKVLCESPLRYLDVSPLQLLPILRVGF